MKALILDGEELFRLSMREVILVAAKIDTIIEAGSETDFLAKMATHDDIDLVVLHPASLNPTDPHSAIQEGKNCLKILQKLYPNIAVVIITESAHDSDEIWSGTTTVTRSSSVTMMVNNIRRAMRLPVETSNAFNTVATPEIRSIAGITGRSFDDHANGEVKNGYVDLDRLSFRQRQILAMAADGLPNKEIAARLTIAEGTVKAHMHAIFKVLDVSNRTQAVIKFGAVQAKPLQAGHYTAL
ncbi:response regulator transcription factor [Kordiimonas aquimaris]|uniref:response regulator transcription factor n=1 Tax=Kordiimonas aquimaris TaxID=707591 RepID=UPI0021CE1355|nr:response regulator transcription factor [Kordiimonas aquimaris]